jgi:hypothetical protein
VQVLYCADRLNIPMDRLNVNGGGITIGHPFGMSALAWPAMQWPKGGAAASAMWW